MLHRATAGFWKNYWALPLQIRGRADKQFGLLVSNPRHPSLQFKLVGQRNGVELWSARVTLNIRALAIRRPNDYLWFWIGDHTTYDLLVS